MTIIQNPTQFKIPTWFLNRQKDIVDGKNYQILSNGVDSKIRDDLERLKKIRAHRGLRHFWGLRVRGQHTKTTGVCFFIIISIISSLMLLRSSRKDRRCVQEARLDIWSICFPLSVPSTLESVYTMLLLIGNHIQIRVTLTASSSSLHTCSSSSPSSNTLSSLSGLLC